MLTNRVVGIFYDKYELLVNNFKSFVAVAPLVRDFVVDTVTQNQNALARKLHSSNQRITYLLTYYHNGVFHSTSM